MNRPLMSLLPALLCAMLLCWPLSACENVKTDATVNATVDGGSTAGDCDPGAFYSCVCDDGNEGLAECKDVGELADCICDPTGDPDAKTSPADTTDAQADEDTVDTSTPPEDVTEEPQDAGPNKDVVEPPPKSVSSVEGTVFAKVGKEEPFLYAGAIVHLESGGKESIAKYTGIRGHFRIGGISPGSWRVCATAKGLEVETCGEFFEVQAKAVTAPPLQIPIMEPAAWGVALLTNEHPCVYRHQDFKVQVDTIVKTETQVEVRTNVHGQFVIPGYEGPLHATCEGAETFADSFGLKKTTMIFPGQAPAPGPIIVTPTAGDSAMRPQLNSTVGVSVNVKDPDGDSVLVRWYSNVGSSELLEGSDVTWKMPKTPVKAVLYGLLSDGMGHHVRVATTVRPGAPLIYEGQLTDAQGSPISGAKITVNMEEVTTADDGSYELQITQDAPRYVVSVTHPKFTPCMQVQHDSWRGSLVSQFTSSPQSKRCMRPLQTQVFQAPEGVTLKNGLTKIVFPGGAFKNPQGQTINGPVEVAWYFGAPGEPLAAEPAIMDEGKVAFAETLGAMYVSFRNPSNPLELVQMDAKSVLVQHEIPKAVTPAPQIRLASANSKSGGMQFEPGQVETSGEQWLYTFPGTEKLFAPTVALNMSSARIHMPATRFPGTMHIAAMVKVPHSTVPQLVIRPVNASIVSFPALPQGANVELIMYRKDKNTSKADKTIGLRELAVSSIFTEAASGPFFEGPLSYALFPFDGFSLDFLWEFFQRRGTFLNRHELEAYDPPDGSATIEPVTFAQSYYTAIDPLAQRTTLTAWLEQLDWIKPNPRSQVGDEAFAIYGNAGDLDFGREMHLQVYDHDNDPLTPDVVAMYTTNYEDVIDAARGIGVAATVAMEYSPHPQNGGAPYIKFYLFDGDGNRTEQIDLDGGGEKAVPDLCVNCHGGRPASPSAIYEEEEGVKESMEYPDEGRLGGLVRYIPYALETFDYAIKTAYSRGAQEENFRKLNESLLKTNINTSSRALLHGMYGSPYNENDVTLAQPGTTQDEHWLPTGNMFDSNGDPVGGDWSGHEELYQDVYQPYCRACHLSFDYWTFEAADSFLGNSGTIRTYLCDDETYMPQAKVTQRALFGDGDALQLLIDEMAAHVNTNANPDDNATWAGSCP